MQNRVRLARQEYDDEEKEKRPTMKLLLHCCQGKRSPSKKRACKTRQGNDK